MVIRIPFERIAKLLTGLIVVLAILHGVSLALHASFTTRLTELLVEKFSFDLERNFPTFFSALLLFLSALLFFLIAWTKRCWGKMKGQTCWVGLGLIFLFLSVDEAAHIHEHFDAVALWNGYKGSGFLSWEWVVVYGGLVGLFVVGYFNFWLRMPPTFKLSYFMAGCIYVLSALGFEMLEAHEYAAHQGAYTLNYAIYTFLEELFEMSAIAFLIYTNLRYLAQVFPTSTFSFVHPHKIVDNDAAQHVLAEQGSLHS